MKPATNAFHAVRFANEEGRGLDLFVTINLSKLGVAADDGCAFISKLRVKMNGAWKYQRDMKGAPLGPFDGLGSHENPDGKRHVHWMVRVPVSARPWFEVTLTKFLRKMSGVEELGTALEIKPIYAAGTLAKYILKGVSSDYAAYFHMSATDQGVVVGRRTFVSRSLSRTARKAAGWKRKRRPRSPRQVASR